MAATGMEPALVLKTAGAGISLTNSLIRIISEHRARGDERDPRLSELLALVPGEALGVANKLVEEIESLRRKFTDKNINLDKSIAELLSELGWWHHLTGGHRLVREFEAEAQKLTEDIGRFLSDFVALARCMEDGETIATAFGDTAGITRELEIGIGHDIPLGEILTILLHQARHQRDQLNQLI